MPDLLNRQRLFDDFLPAGDIIGEIFIGGFLGAVLGLTFCMALGWAGWNYFIEAWRENWTTDTVWAIPLWIPLLPLPLGIGLLTLQYLVEILCLLSGREPPFGIAPEKRVPEEQTPKEQTPEKQI